MRSLLLITSVILVFPGFTIQDTSNQDDRNLTLMLGSINQFKLDQHKLLLERLTSSGYTIKTDTSISVPKDASVKKIECFKGNSGWVFLKVVDLGYLKVFNTNFTIKCDSSELAKDKLIENFQNQGLHLVINGDKTILRENLTAKVIDRRFQKVNEQEFKNLYECEISTIGNYLDVKVMKIDPTEFRYQLGNDPKKIISNIPEEEDY